MRFVDEYNQTTSEIKEYLRKSYLENKLSLNSHEESILKHVLGDLSIELQESKVLFEIDESMALEHVLYSVCQTFSLVTGENIDWFVEKLEQRLEANNVSKISNLQRLHMVLLLKEWGSRIGEARLRISNKIKYGSNRIFITCINLINLVSLCGKHIALSF